MKQIVTLVLFVSGCFRKWHDRIKVWLKSYQLYENIGIILPLQQLAVGESFLHCSQFVPYSLRLGLVVL